MMHDEESNNQEHARSVLSSIGRFFGDIAKDVLASFSIVVLTFCFATAVTAVTLWYYQWPLFLSPVGGFVVLGVMLLFWYDS